MKKVLLISYVFPPMAAVGGFRAVKACKFLPQFGWQPSVLTVKGGFNYAFDHAALEQLADDLKVYRSRNLSPFLWWDRRRNAQSESNAAPQTELPAPGPETSRSIFSRMKSYVRTMLSLPDYDCFWIPFGIITGLRAIRRDRVNIILSSSPPASGHVVGYILSLLTGRPLVTDFRDLWTQNEGYHLRQLPRLYRRLDRFLERRVLRRSWAIITATQTFADQVRQNNPDLDPARVHAVTNGVDPDDFEGLKFPDRKNQKFLILHLGSLYGNRDPRFFFKAVEQWIAQRPEVVSQTEIRFVGNTPGFAKTVAGTPLEAMVNFTGHAPHRQVLSMLWEANLLLLILGFDPSGAGVMPAKLYEYIATGRPILALIPDGIAADRIRKYNRGEPVTGEDISSVIQTLNRQFDLWRESSKPEPSGLDLPEEFDRRLQNKKLAGILDRVVLKTDLT